MLFRGVEGVLELLEELLGGDDRLICGACRGELGFENELRGDELLRFVLLDALFGGDDFLTAGACRGALGFERELRDEEFPRLMLRDELCGGVGVLLGR